METSLRTVSAILFLALAATVAVAQTKRMPERGAGKASAPKTGTMVINPQFDEAQPFSEGLAAVRIGGEEDGKWGFIDKSGKFVINPQFDKTDDFSEGLAPARLGDEKTGKWGYIDKSGKFAIAPRWESVSGFRHGLAVVHTGEILSGSDRIIDKAGHYASDLQAASIGVCDGETLVVSVDEHWDGEHIIGHDGFADRSGRFMINPEFAAAGCFAEGLAAARQGGTNPGKWGFIDKSGNFAIAPQWVEVSAFEDGLAMVAVADGVAKKWGMINKAGKYIIEPQYRERPFYSEGLAAVSISSIKWIKDQHGTQKMVDDVKYGFVDRTGRIVIDTNYDKAFYFGQGLAPVRIGDLLTGKDGFIDKSGHLVINPQFDFASYFKEGLAAVRVGDVIDKETGFQPGKWGYIAR
jgi:hypothetical protein